MCGLGLSPFINFMDEMNTKFLSEEYFSKMSLLRQDPSKLPITSDLSLIEE